MPAPAHDAIAHGRVFHPTRLPSGRILVRDRTVPEGEALRVAPALEDAFARHDALAVAGARRTRAGLVSAHGAFVAHPKGFHRAGRGAPAEAERFDAEVDAIDGGVAVIDMEAYARARGEALLDPCTGYGALGLLAVSLEARRTRIGRVMSVAAASIEESAEFESILETEGFRNDLASSHARVHFGFDVEGCDLDLVPMPMRWNAPVWGAPAGFDKYDARGAYHWELYRTHDAFRRRADTLVGFLVANLPEGPLPVLDIGAGDALFAGLLAGRGISTVAVDPEPGAVAAARGAVDAAGLAGQLRCEQGVAEALPFPAHAFRAALLLDVIEHLRNPLRALAEAARVLAPGGVLLVATPAWRFGHRADPVYHLDEYREEELVRQLRAAGMSIVHTARIKGAYDDLVVLARA